MRPIFQTQYTHNRNRSESFSTINTMDSMTQQSDANDADINVIVARFVKTGQMPNINAQAISGDFTGAGDFRAMQDQINVARAAFQTLPADIRKRFSNDPAEFIEFASNGDNLDELKKMGLTKPVEIKPTTLDDINTTLKDIWPKNKQTSSDQQSTLLPKP